jgi:urease accessory protein
MSAAPANLQHSWQAELELGFTRQQSKTVLSTRKHIGPLIVQRPFYPEGDVCHVYIVHPPGGIVGGDQLKLNATLHDGSHTLITTPAATKFYRTAAERQASLTQTLTLHNATLEWLPQETIVFREANAKTITRVQLDSSSKFIGWEMTCFGRPACNELFDLGRMQQHFELWLNDRPLWLDRLRIDRLRLDGQGDAMTASWGLASHTVIATLAAYPATVDDLQAARDGNDLSCTLVDQVLLCRLLSNDSHLAKQIFVQLWQRLRPRIIGRESCLPRIWAT